MFNTPYLALIDTGSQINCISEELYENFACKHNITQLPTTGVSFRGAVGQSTHKIKRRVLIKLCIEKMLFDFECFVVPKLIMDLFIGAEFLTSMGGVIDYSRQCLILNIENEQIVAPFEKSLLTAAFLNDNISLQIEKIQVNPTERSRLKKLFLIYHPLFRDEPGLTNLYCHKIDMVDKTPFREHSYPVPFALREKVETELNRMINQGIIKRSASAYCSPMTVVRKKDGSVRICLDARRINKAMAGDNEAPQPVEELLQKFDGIKFMSSLDLRSSYWQIPLNVESQQYTGFAYNNRTYVYKVLPFGLKTAVGSFTRAMDLILGAELQDFVTVYVDDILITSKTIDEHFQHLELVFKQLLRANFTINLEKSCFFQAELKFLGHIISTEGIWPDPDKITAIKNFPPPRNIKGLRGFLGLCNFYRRFHIRYNFLTAQLGHLLKKDIRWCWGDREQNIFDNIKSMFLKCVILVHPVANSPFYLETDSSNFGIGGVLFQIVDQEHRVIAFHSKGFNGPELRYTTTEKELLAIINCLKKFKTYVLGRKLIIRTDHQAIKFLKPQNVWNDRITRWMLFLQQFDMVIEHISGKENLIADTLSRSPEGIDQLQLRVKEFLINAIETNVSGPIEEYLPKLKHLQRRDPHIKKIINKIHSRPGECGYEIKDGVVVRKTSNFFQFVVPRKLECLLTDQYHKDLGHFGPRKTYSAIRRFLYWPKMRTQITKRVQGCDICQKAKVPNRDFKGPMQPIISNNIEDLVAVDFFGPLPSTRYGYKYLFVVLDIFSKYVQIYPLRRATATGALKAIEKFNEILKITTILSDHGSQFTSKRWQEVLKERKIRVTYCTPYHPASNPAERVMRELGRLLRTYCHKNQTQWYNYVQDFNNLLNAVCHESTDCSPHEIIFKTIPIWPVDRILSKIYPFLTNEPKSVCLDHVRKIYLSRAEKRKKTYDRFIKNNSFKVGDLVLLKTHYLSKGQDKYSKKLDLLYTGPYRIREFPHTNVVSLDHPDGTTKCNVNYSEIKPYVDRT